MNGDGYLPVARLVDAANEDRRQLGDRVSQVPLTVDLDMRRTLAKQGLSFRSVPAAGETVTRTAWFPKFGGKGGNQAVAAATVAATPTTAPAPFLLAPGVGEAGSSAATAR